jgi:hypothetical protein
VHIMSVYEFNDFTFMDAKKKLERSSFQKVFVSHLFEDMFDDSKDRYLAKVTEIEFKDKEMELKKLFARNKGSTTGPSGVSKGREEFLDPDFAEFLRNDKAKLDLEKAKKKAGLKSATDERRKSVDRES